MENNKMIINNQNALSIITGSFFIFFLFYIIYNVNILYQNFEKIKDLFL